MSAPAETLTALAALALYRRKVLPAARRELDTWDERAARMPEGPLREAALEALKEKRSNPEATAVFAILAPRPQRARALRAMCALQVAVDYLDCLGEVTVDDPLGDGLALHGALVDAVSLTPPQGEWYRLHPESEDGGYLAALVGACSEELAELPSTQVVLPTLRQAAQRCGEGQSRTHASATAGDAAALREWALELPAAPSYEWWEVAAGACSSVAAHALIAAAADPATTAEQAEAIDAAYFPPVGALTVLLDDLLDREEDLDAREHNYLAYYDSAPEAAKRISAIAEQGRAAVSELPGARRHGAILAGVAGFYVGVADERDEYAAAVRAPLRRAVGPAVRPISAALRRRGHG